MERSKEILSRPLRYAASTMRSLGGIALKKLDSGRFSRRGRARDLHLVDDQTEVEQVAPNHTVVRKPEDKIVLARQLLAEELGDADVKNLGFSEEEQALTKWLL